MEPIDAHQFWL